MNSFIDYGVLSVLPAFDREKYSGKAGDIRKRNNTWDSVQSFIRFKETKTRLNEALCNCYCIYQL